MKDKAINESLTMDIANDNIAYAILDMLAQKNLKLGTGMLELDYGVRGSYRLAIKGGSILYKKNWAVPGLCSIFPIIFYDAAKTGPYACALSTMLQLAKNGITIVAIDDSDDEIIIDDSHVMMFMRPNATIDELQVEYDLWSSTI